VTFEIKKVSQIIENTGVKAILHGLSGSGKTFSISTLPHLDRTIVLSAEAGLRALKRLVDADGNKIGDIIDGVQIDNITKLRAVHNFLKIEENKYVNIVLDSLTEIAEQVLASEKEKTNDGRKAYGEMNEIILKIIRSFRDLPEKNVIMICQQAKTQDENGRILYAPSMPGKTVAQKLPFMFDIVGCLRTHKDEEGNIRRAIQFAPDEIYEAKDRDGTLDAFEKVDWKHIFNKLSA
jgi:phage nucleotide-binding protein